MTLPTQTPFQFAAWQKVCGNTGDTWQADCGPCAGAYSRPHPLSAIKMQCKTAGSRQRSAGEASLSGFGRGHRGAREREGGVQKIHLGSFFWQRVGVACLQHLLSLNPVVLRPSPSPCSFVSIMTSQRPKYDINSLVRVPDEGEWPGDNVGAPQHPSCCLFFRWRKCLATRLRRVG